MEGGWPDFGRDLETEIGIAGKFDSALPELAHLFLRISAISAFEQGGIHAYVYEHRVGIHSLGAHRANDCENPSGKGRSRFIQNRHCSASPRSEEHTSELQSLMRISY